MKLECLIALGGGLGALLRYKLGAWIHTSPWAGLHAHFPLGTLSVNLLGCLLAGLVLGFHTRYPLNEAWRVFLFVGLLGGFTTFSTFGIDTINLCRRGDFGWASCNVLISVLGGLLLLFIALKAWRAV